MQLVSMIFALCYVPINGSDLWLSSLVYSIKLKAVRWGV